MPKGKHRTALVLGTSRSGPNALLVIECENDDAALKFYNEVASKTYSKMHLVSLMTPDEYLER
jgi:hypothetical protein